MTRAAAVEEHETVMPTISPTTGRSASSATPAVEPVELEATLEAIRTQARRDPQGYLARTVVPEGGE